MEKITFQKVFYDFLEVSGHNPELTDSGDIFIKYREGSIYFQFSDNDSRFYRSIYRIDYDCETEVIENKFYKAALITNSQIKFAKICLKEQKGENKGGIYVVVDILLFAKNETLKNQPSELKKYLDISLFSTQEAINLLAENVNEIIKEKK